MRTQLACTVCGFYDPSQGVGMAAIEPEHVAVLGHDGHARYPPNCRARLPANTVNKVWDAVKNMRIGDEHVRNTNAQQLRRDFNNIYFKEGKSIDEFGVRITMLAKNLRSLGDNITDVKVVKKLLLVVPEKLNPATIFIEMFLNLNVVTVEEVTGRLCIFEQRTKPKQITNSMERLMLYEED
jgi:hypothetical protein